MPAVGRDAVFCCLECRLLQDPAEACRECSSPSIAAIQYESDVLQRVFKRQRGKVANAAANTGMALGGIGAYVGVVAAGMISPIIPVVGLTAMIGGLVILGRKSSRITTVPYYPATTDEHATTVKGIAHKLSELVETCDGAERVLVEETVLRGKGDAVYFRRVNAAPFLVELEGGARLVVDGTLRLEAKSSSSTVKAGDPLLAALGIVGVSVAGRLDRATLREGDPVEITGVQQEDVIQELAVDRDGGQATVMRGRAKSVVRVRQSAR